MAVTYTPIFGFPQFDPNDPTNWGSVMNGFFLDADLALAEADNPLVWEGNTAGRLDGSELLTFDDEVLTYI